MTVIVATRMKIGSWRHAPAFLRSSLAAARQAARSPGFIGGRLKIDANGAFWTLTAWQSDGDMAAFRGSGVHAKAAPRLAGWACEGAFATWHAGAPEVPPWATAVEQISANGNFATLDAPSPRHLNRQISTTRRALELPITRAHTLSASTSW